jgi:hypothetical protein
LSDVVLEMVPTTPAQAGQAPTLPIAPTTLRTFSRGDQVRAFLQIYEGTRRTDAVSPVTTRVRVSDAQGRAVHDESLVFTEKDFQNRRLDHHIDVPVDRLTAGEYLLTVDADMKNHTARRAVRFAVR